MSLKGKRALVTGASRGLGAVIAADLVRAGAAVWLTARTDEDLASVAAGLANAEGSVCWSRCDVGDPIQVERLAAEVGESWTAVDFVVNNAGVWLEGPLAANSNESIAEVLRVNLLGPIYVCRAFLPLLESGTSSHIVNVGSTSALEPQDDWPVYSASKYGLRGFSESLALSLESRGVRVSIVNPGGLNTHLYAAAGYPEKRDQPWMMTPERVSAAICCILDLPSDVRIATVEIRKFG